MACRSIVILVVSITAGMARADTLHKLATELEAGDVTLTSVLVDGELTQTQAEQLDALVLTLQTSYFAYAEDTESLDTYPQDLSTLYEHVSSYNTYRALIVSTMVKHLILDWAYERLRDIPTESELDAIEERLSRTALRGEQLACLVDPAVSLPGDAHPESVEEWAQLIAQSHGDKGYRPVEIMLRWANKQIDACVSPEVSLRWFLSNEERYMLSVGVLNAERARVINFAGSVEFLRRNGIPQLILPNNGNAHLRTVIDHKDFKQFSFPVVGVHGLYASDLRDVFAPDKEYVPNLLFGKPNRLPPPDDESAPQR